jgi:hypothetical protein
MYMYIYIYIYMPLYTEKTVIKNPENPKLRLDQLHKKLKLNYGNFTEAYPEQEMSVIVYQTTQYCFRKRR